MEHILFECSVFDLFFTYIFKKRTRNLPWKNRHSFILWWFWRFYVWNALERFILWIVLPYPISAKMQYEKWCTSYQFTQCYPKEYLLCWNNIVSSTVMCYLCERFVMYMSQLFISDCGYNVKDILFVWEQGIQ